MTTENAEQIKGPDRLSDDVLAWLNRDDENQEAWKQNGRDVFLSSNGDSVLSRTMLASQVRRYFLEDRPETEIVRRWNKGHTEIVSVRVDPPRISASNAGYVDWLFIADYLLLCCSGAAEFLLDENTRRDSAYQQLMSSYEIRRLSWEACQLIRQDPETSDEEILATLRRKNEKASMANVKQARRLVKPGNRTAEPVKPEQAEALQAYRPIYF